MIAEDDELAWWACYRDYGLPSLRTGSSSSKRRRRRREVLLLLVGSLSLVLTEAGER